MPLSVVFIVLVWHEGASLSGPGISAPCGFENGCDRAALAVAHGHHVDGTGAAPGEIRHEVVKRGNHPSELEAAEYVIASTFTSGANAERFSEGLRSLEYPARKGYVSEKALWYVYIYKGTSAEQARSRQSQFTKRFLLRDAWWLTVEP